MRGVDATVVSETTPAWIAGSRDVRIVDASGVPVGLVNQVLADVRDAFLLHAEELQRTLEVKLRKALGDDDVAVLKQCECARIAADTCCQKNGTRQVSGLTGLEDLHTAFQIQGELAQRIVSQQQILTGLLEAHSQSGGTTILQHIDITFPESGTTFPATEGQLADHSPSSPKHSDEQALVTAARNQNHHLSKMVAEPSGVVHKQRCAFNTIDMKKRARAILIKPVYNVAEFYHQTGVCQNIATSGWFEQLTLFVIFVNAVWIGVDADYNDAKFITDAHLIFQVAEHLFCSYFFLEWLVRFGSFKVKLNCLKDSWFAFDTILIVLMILETWVILIVLAVSSGVGEASFLFQDAGILRLLRLARLVRMFRMAKLLRTMPEILVLAKALTTATRTVAITLIFLLGIVYIFAVIFSQLCADTELGQLYFPTALVAMHELLIVGAFPDNADIMRAAWSENRLHWVVLFGFMLLSILAVMNMMVGVLVEVVKGASAWEKESMDVIYLRDNILAVLKAQGHELGEEGLGSVILTKDEFWALMEIPRINFVLQDTGVDVCALVDLVDYIYLQDEDRPFSEIVELILTLRSSNKATVKDMVELRKHLTDELTRLHHDVGASAFRPTQAAFHSPPA